MMSLTIKTHNSVLYSPRSWGTQKLNENLQKELQTNFDAFIAL